MIGRSFSHYRIVEKIGQGGMGEVFLAEDTSLERKVAIKFLPQAMVSDHVARERFLREAKSAATLDHPHICVVHEASEVEGAPFIVMEYVEGESLRERMARGPLPLEETLSLAAEIAEALEEAHSRHIVHRDLKPANVMLTRTGHVKVMDFGLAKRLASSEGRAPEEETLTELTQMGTTVGTLAYMSPEQLQGREVDHRSDIFAFGALLYEMLAGIHPFRKEVGMATAAAILSTEPAPLAQHAPEIPQRLVQLVSEMLTKTPAQRIQSMRAVHEQLKQILLEVQARPEETGVLNLRKLGRSLLRPRVAIPAVAVLIALVLVGIWLFDRQAKVRWAREEALPEIERLIGQNNVWRNLTAPYILAEKAEAYIPHDPRLAVLFPKCSVKMNIRTEPPGAKISCKDYEAPESEWKFLGTSPIEKIRVPIGIFRWKIEKEGYRTVLAAAATWDLDLGKQGMIIPYEFRRRLDKEGNIPTAMVRVSGAETDAGKLNDFYIDSQEVTNKQYKEFIKSGGYRNRTFWKHRFFKDGRELTWDAAIRDFIDQSGQPGPPAWQAGDYPEGQDDYPVSGISWYEAAAYAEFAGKSLPTGAHWGLARGERTPMIQWPQLGGFGVFAPFSNFKGKGPIPVGSLPGITPYGASDMAGNVREWCWNETPKGRMIRGGAWNDNTYMFGVHSQAPPMDRSPKNGFRCALYPEPEKIPAAVFQAARWDEPKDFYKQKPVPDAIYQVYKEQFSYDKTDLKARVESRRESSDWSQERITFDAGYGGERIIAHLFLPRNSAPPFQAVIYYPGDASFFNRSSKDLEDYHEFPMFLSFIVKNGRAVLYPVYKGTFERGNDSLLAIYTGAPNSRQWAELFVQQQVKDVKRCIDYLETRQDVSRDKLAFYGMSQGALLGPIITAVEDRFRASVLVAGGLVELARPEANPINYVTRVRTPTLMLNGRYDGFYGLETSAKPMFDLLGTPAGDKQLKVYETDHIPPRNEFIKETLAWLDRYLGPVKQP